MENIIPRRLALLHFSRFDNPHFVDGKILRQKTGRL